MKRWLEIADWSLTTFAFLYVTIKAPLIGITWPEVMGIGIVLIVHYARHFVPRKMVQMPEIEKITAALETIESLKGDVSNLKLAQGFSRKS